MMLHVCREFLRRDLMLAYRRRGEILTPLIFFAMITTFFPFGLQDTSPRLLSAIGPAVIWIDALLAMLLAQSALFAHDYEDGTLEQLVLSPQPLELLVLMRVAANWLVTGLPVVIGGAVVAAMLFVPARDIGTVVAGLLLGTPVLTLLGTLVAALTVSLRQAAVLGPVLVLPLVTPVLIFGAHSTTLAMEGQSTTQAFEALAAMFILSVSLLPAAAAVALRISHEG